MHLLAPSSCLSPPRLQDERNQILTSYLWIRQVWVDAYLTWSKDDYDGIDILHIPSSYVWRPDIVLYNKWVYRPFVSGCTGGWEAAFPPCPASARGSCRQGSGDGEGLVFGPDPVGRSWLPRAHNSCKEAGLEGTSISHLIPSSA